MSEQNSQLLTDDPVQLPILPLRDIVVFPHMVAPLFVGRAPSIGALEVAADADKLIFLVSQIDPKVDNPTEDDIYRIGTIGKVAQLLKLPDGTVKVLVEGLRRARMIEF